MMKNLKVLLLALCIAGASSLAYAADDTATPQKTHPDAQKGDYLPPQPDVNGATDSNAKSATDSNTKPMSKHSKHKKGSTSKPAALEKGKSHTEPPESGGVEVQSK